MNSYLKFLSRNKAYTAIDVFGLAISMMFVVLIGCYTWQEWHIDKQHRNADRMYYLGLNFNGSRNMGSHWYVPVLLKDKFPEIEASTAIFRNSRWLTYDGKQILTNCYFVDPSFYDMFDFKLIQGDPKTVLDNPSNIVVTPEYARKVWGDGDPMGKSIIFNDAEEPFVVAGVMEPMKNTAFMTPEKTPVDMLINFSMMKYVNSSLTAPEMYNASGADVILLAKEGHDLTARKKEYHDALKDSYWVLSLPENNITFDVLPFKGSYFSDVQSGHMNFGNYKIIKLLLSVGLVILLFAIMNYINLTIALAGKRAKEMATRRLLGENRSAIMWRLIGESAILCSVSMLIGIGLAFLMQPYASSVLNTPIDIAGCMNIFTIAFLVVVLLIMSFAAGVIPAVLLSSMKPIEAVKGAFRRKSNMVFSKVFIVVQNVATITMVASALTMYLQVRHMIDAPLGYDPEGIINLWSQYLQNDDSKEEVGGETFRQELLKLPCVEKVSFSQGTPHSRGCNNTMSYEGHTISFQTFVCDTVFMDLLGLKVKKDNHTTDPDKHYLNDRSLNELGLDENATEYTYYDKKPPIAGIIEDFKIGNVLTDQHPLQLVTSKPYEDFWPWNVLIKVKGDKAEALKQVKSVYERLYSSNFTDMAFGQPFMSQEIEADFDAETRLSTIITIFAMIAIIISMLGLMAMSTYYVRQRSLDIAVHKVMGGTSAEVLIKLVRTFMLYVLIAVLISVPVIYYVMNDWLSQFSYRISVYWWIYLVSAILAIVICLVSVVAQCYRGANSNPVDSLK